MDLRRWLIADHADVCTRIRTQVLARVPRERWNEHLDDETSSIAWILWHALRHQDVALNAVVRQRDDVLATDDWAARLGVADLAPGTGLSEAGDRAAAARLDLGVLDAYAEAVWATTGAWLDDVDLGVLDEVADAGAGLQRAGVAEDGYPWLYRMWTGKPVAFHVSWETIGHGYNHLGEMVNVRNRMGCGGF
jgi:hypothetical protein